jgi:hypothetical protein
VGDGAVDSGDSGTVDSGSPPSCPESLVTGVTFDLDPDGVDTQIHASAVWDGSRAVIAYNLPDPSGGFDVFVTSLACDGTAGTPTRINTTDANDVNPEIAIGGAGYFVAWMTDDGTGIDNLHIYGRALDTEARPLGESDVEIRTTREDAPVVGNHSLGKVIAVDDGFVVTGERGLEAISRFHAFAQSIDAAGALIGEAFEPAFEPMVTHRGVTAASTPLGLMVAYERIPDDESGQVVLVREGEPGVAELVVEGLVASGTADLAAIDDYVFGVISGDVIRGATDLRLTELGTPEGARPVEVLGAARRVDTAPQIALGDGGSGAVAYFRLSGGAFGPLILQRFSFDGSAFTVGPEVEVAASGAAPYGPALTWVTGDVYFVAWAEGMSPAVRLKGRYVDLSPSP